MESRTGTNPECLLVNQVLLCRRKLGQKKPPNIKNRYHLCPIRSKAKSKQRVAAMAALPGIMTPTLLNSIKKYLDLPAHTWYFIIAATLSSLNRPDEIASVYEHAIHNGPCEADVRPNHDEQLRITRRMREALIKVSAVGGLPKVKPSSRSWMERLKGRRRRREKQLVKQCCCITSHAFSCRLPPPPPLLLSPVSSHGLVHPDI